METIIEIIKYINAWQKNNDVDFKSIPIDNHSYLIFNHKNQIYRFIFSNDNMRNICRASIPQKLLNNYDYMIEQEDGFTYYLFTEGDY